VSPDDNSFNFTPEEYQDLWLLALSESSVSLKAQIENIHKSKGITNADSESIASQILEAARAHLAPATENDILALEKFIADWHSDGSPRSVACNVIEKLIRSFRQHSSDLNSLEENFAQIEETFLDCSIKKSRCLGQSVKESLHKAGVFTNRDLVTLSDKGIEKLSLKTKIGTLWERLSYELAIFYIRARKDLYKPYSENLQARALRKISGLRSEGSHITPRSRATKKRY
jgi:hypothetical protein